MDPMESALREREKELDSLYALAALMIDPPGSVERFLVRAAELLRGAFQHPDRVRIRIRYGSVETREPDAPEESGIVLRAGIPTDSDSKGEIVAYYPVCEGSEPCFLERERLLVTSIAGLLYAALRRFRAESRSRRRNAALREILYRFEGEKRLLIRRVRQVIDREVLVPLGRDPSLRPWADLLSNTLGNLRVLVEPELQGIYEGLSPREIEVCRLVRGGLTTKEIARSLGLSELTVERHRHNIRKKLGLDKDTTLSSFLLSNP